MKSVSIDIVTGQSEWGPLRNAEADPRRGLEPLMLVENNYIQQLLASGPQPGPWGGTHSASSDGQRIFAHMDYLGQRTTWELFPAHFDDGLGPDDMLIGRWPD